LNGLRLRRVLSGVESNVAKFTGPAGPRRVSRRRALRIGLLLPAAGLALPGCAPQPPPLIEGVDSVGSGLPQATDLQALLDRRAKAQLDKNERAYLADLDPSNQAMLAREKLAFANLRQFELADVRFVTGRVLGGPQPDQKDPNRYLFTPVIKVVKLTADTGPKPVLGPSEGYEYVLTKRGDGWQIADIVPYLGDVAANAGVSSASAPWNLHPLKVVHAGNVWLAADESVDDLDVFAAAAKTQAAEVEAIWGKRTRFPGHIVFLSRNQQNLRAWYDLAGQADDFEGVQVPLYGVTKEGQPYTDQFYAARMVLFLPNIEKYTDDPALVMRHELTHAVTSRAMDASLQSDTPPRWAIEGFARYIEVQGNSERQRTQRFTAAEGLRDGLLKHPLPRSKDFYGEKAIQFNYAAGYAVFAYVEQKKGENAAIAFYAEVIKYAEPFGQPLAETPAFDGICRRVLDLSASDLLAGWKSFVRAGG
jgi:hypothetical protein